MCVCAFIYVCIYICVCVYVYIYIYMIVYVCVYIYIHVYMYDYVYIYIYIRFMRTSWDNMFSLLQISARHRAQHPASIHPISGPSVPKGPQSEPA